jgi:hypothetical protein
MGCDIHFKLERRLKKTTENTEENKWNTTDYSIDAEYGERSYWMFAHMANVRSYENNENYPEPKGLPEDISDRTKLSCSLLCPKTEKRTYEAMDREVKRDKYEEWTRWNKDLKFEFTDYYAYLNEYYDAMYHIDMHSHSWLTTEEYEDCFNKAYKREENGETVYEGAYVEWYILLQRMKAYEEFGKYEVRIVFWFDN